MPDIHDLKESADKLAKQAKETAELSVQVVRDQIHSMVKDPEMVRKMEEAEALFDKQFGEATRRIEEGTNQMMSVLNNLMSQVKEKTAPETTEQGAAKPKD